MATDIPVINLYLDYAKPGGIEPLLDGFKSKPVYSRPAVMSGDVCKIRLYFRTRNVNPDTDSTEETIPEGATIVLAGKAASNLAAATLLFCCSTFAETTGIDGEKCYEGTLDLTSSELASAMAGLASNAEKLTARIDIEVRNAGNTARVTYQTNIEVYRQVYAGETAPSPVVYPFGNLTAPDGGVWQLGITNDGQPTFTKVA